MAIALIATVTSADVLTFDDVTTAVPGLMEIPDGYGGLDWGGNLGVVIPSAVPEYAISGWINGVVSGDYVSGSSQVQLGTVSGATFNFEGAYLTAAWNIGLNVNIRGYNNGSEVYNQSVLVDPWAPVWFAFNFNNIDELTFISSGGVDAGFEGPGSGEHFVMDDFTYEIIPEPSSTAMIGLVSVFGLFIRRRFML